MRARDVVAQTTPWLSRWSLDVAMEKRFSRRGALSAEDNKFLVAEVESLRIGLFFRVHYKGNCKFPLYHQHLGVSVRILHKNL